MKMTLYRMLASDDYTMVQAQYALSFHQEEVRKEPWFLEFVMNNLYQQIKEKADTLDLGPVEWRGWTEVWKYAGEMDWEDPEPESDHLQHYQYCNCLADSGECCREDCNCHGREA